VSGSSTQLQHSLADRRVVLVGKLASMSRRDAERLVRQHGGQWMDRITEATNLIVVSDERAHLEKRSANRELFDDDTCARIARGEIEMIGESELWARMGLVESGQGIERLYTPAMLAELVRVPIATIRQWHRRGVLLAKREVRRLAYFDFEEVRVARKLADLLHAGCSLSTVNRKLAGLARLLPNIPRPLADPSVVVQGHQLVVRRGDGLAEPSGQLLIDFDIPRGETGDHDTPDEGPVAIPFIAADALRKSTAPKPVGVHPYASDDLRNLAAELEESGRQDQAVEVYRAVLMSGDSSADDHFALAELLYQAGDLSAARERYYAAIELDEDFVEARSNLGCVLAERGDLGLAEAAFRGALEYHPDYADAHYHLARLLDRGNRSSEASRHWQLFMNLAPASPWADEARERMGLIE
jgi:Tfp pilus assembly protein PilF/DNA-binding transcriptional MerR regulator